VGGSTGSQRSSREAPANSSKVEQEEQEEWKLFYNGTGKLNSQYKTFIDFYLYTIQESNLSIIIILLLYMFKQQKSLKFKDILHC
jgi:hypothetical protein